MEKLVSIVTPCYNGAKYIDTYAESLLRQDYCNCQLIFVDDGSKDNSREKIFSYKSRFEKKGFSFEYYYQCNSGQAAAIAKGLSYVKGDYFIWPDVDDLLTESSIRKKVDFLEKNHKYGIVRTDFMVVDEKDITTVLEYGAQKYKDRYKEDLFADYLLSRNMWLQPGCYMIRTEALLKSNPDKFIYKSRAGQNWQVVLPVLYYFKCGYINEPLYIYILHKGSHSHHAGKSYEDSLKRYEEYEKLIIETVKHMKAVDEEKYCSLVRKYYAGQKLSMAFENRRKNDAKKFYNIMVQEGCNSYRDKLKMQFADSYIVHKCVDFLRVVRKIGKIDRK